MKRWLWRLLLVTLLAGAGFWGWRAFFPGPEQVIRKRFAALSRLASFSAREGPAAQAYNSLKLADFCAPDVQLAVDVPGLAQHTFTGRDQVREAAMAARATLTSFKVEFVDLKVSIGLDRSSAVVNLTAKAMVPGEGDMLPQEFKVLLRKAGGEWLISRAETVKPLL